MNSRRPDFRAPKITLSKHRASKGFLFLFTMLALAGCTTNAGRGSRLLPWNWFAPDHATALAEQKQETQDNEQQLVAESHRDLHKTVETLQRDPAPSPHSVQALVFARHGLGLLDQVRQIPFADRQADAALVRDLFSDDPAIRAAALQQQARADKRAEDLARDLSAARDREAKVTTQLQESDRRYQAEAEQARRWKFWIFVIVGGWVALQLISGLARFYPPLAPIASFAGHIAAPAVQAAYNRVTTAVGRTLSDIEGVTTSATTATANLLRDRLDANSDTADQAAIRQAYNNSP